MLLGDQPKRFCSHLISSEQSFEEVSGERRELIEQKKDPVFAYEIALLFNERIKFSD